MLRRDAFIQTYTATNNPKELEVEVIELEKFVDTALVADAAVLHYVNQNGLSGTSGYIDTQYVTSSISNNSIHRDPNILDNGSGRTGPNKEYAIWSSGLTNSTGQNASSTPYYDLTINTSITGELRVTLPENTNKNAAYLLMQKYLGPLQADSNLITQSQIDTMGFWGRKPILGSNGTSALLDPSAVQLQYDSSINRLVMIFKL